MTNNLTLTEFIPGGKVKAQEINGNFTTLKDAIELTKDQLDDSVSAINTDISELEVEISELENEVEKLTSMPNFCMKSGNVDANGNADLLEAPDIGTAVTLYPRPNLTSNGTAGGSSFAVYCDGFLGGTDNSYAAVDGNSSTYYHSNAGLPKNYYMYFPGGIIMKSLQITNAVVSGYNPGISSGVIKGSNNGTNWVDIASFTNSSIGNGLTWNIDLNLNTTSYSYYCINITGSAYLFSGNYYAIIQNIDIYYQATISTATNCLFKVGSSYPGLTLTYADKSQEVLTSLQNIQGLTTNGNYTVIKEKGQNPVAVSSAKVTQGKIFPASPSEGDHHCLTATDLKTYKRVSGAWVETQYVPLGNITIAGNVITAVTTNPYNQNGYNFNCQTQGYRMPDYLKGISKTWGTTYTAECDGWVRIYGTTHSSATTFELWVNGVNISYFDVAASSTHSSLTPISKGDTYAGMYGDTVQAITFYPAKGAN